MTVAAEAQAPIVRLLDEPPPAPNAAFAPGDDTDATRGRARAFAEPLLAGRRLATGEDALAHADGLAAILHGIGASPALQAAAYLVYAGDFLQRPDEVIAKAFGESHAGLVSHTRRLVQLERAARGARAGVQGRAQQVERVRRMLLAFSRDLRVVLLRLASRLQTLRFVAASRAPYPAEALGETLHVYAPLANRLGIWQIKWELEDLAFRFLDPTEYHRVARLLDERRVAREAGVEAFRRQLADDLAAHGLAAEVHGRPKHIYSIWKKMQAKRLDFAEVLDLRAVRVIVDDAAACYRVLGRVHERYRLVAGEFDDYIERPKPNGYRSLHTVVEDAAGRAVEVQIRTRAMHEHAEQGVAAHWAYKDAGAKGYAGAGAGAAQQHAEVAEARKAVLRQLLEWEREAAEPDAPAVGAEPAAGPRPSARGRVGGAAAALDSAGAVAARIYVFTPEAEVVELSAGATPVDFAYAVHTDLGHRCRGARVDGAIVPLGTPLRSGQTVQIVAAKEGGPSLDWLNADLGLLTSHRARAKVRAWFNHKAQRETIQRGREAVERLLQREGRTAVRHDELAARLGFGNADALFEIVGKDELSLRTIETLLRPPAPPPSADAQIANRRFGADAPAPKGGVLVVGVESLMTHLARCCRPAPPDRIGGYVTRSRGVAVHRASCTDFARMTERAPERVIPVEWGAPAGHGTAAYPVDVSIEAADRQGLLRDISELFAKGRMNVVGVQSQSVKDTAKSAAGGTAWMTFTVEVADATRLARVLDEMCRVPGVRAARRK